jgi:glycosyltransferase involved in cell wall biosynthesis
MRVLHIIPSLDPAGGGPPVVTLALASAMCTAGHPAAVVSYVYPGSEQRIAEGIARIPNSSAIVNELLPAPSSWEQITGRGTKRFLDGYVKDFDFVHMHGVWEPIIAAGASAARDAGKPYAFTPHGMLHPWSMRQRPIKKKLAMALRYRALLDGAAFIHVLNEDERSAVELLSLKAPAKVVPNGIFPQEFESLPEAGSFYRTHPELGGKPYVLFLGRVHYKKGLDLLADAIGKIGDAHLVVAGPDGGARGEFEQRVKALGLTDRVHLVGGLYGQEKLAALVDAGCFCLPSRQEGFSIAVLEAMACGTSVVISRECNFPEVEASRAGIVTRLDAEEIAAGLSTVLNDADRRKQMSAAGRELVRTRYTWPKIVEAMMEIYRRHGKTR